MLFLSNRIKGFVQSIILATSFSFAESFSFSVSVKTTGIDHIAVLVDHNERIRFLSFKGARASLLP